MSSVAAYRGFHFHLPHTRVPASASTPACSRGGIFKRIFAAVERSRQRRIEQEAGRFIAKHGGRITDDVERQLNGHFSGGGFPPYRPQRAFRPFAGPCGS
jgi:hypothetical protein